MTAHDLIRLGFDESTSDGSGHVDVGCSQCLALVINGVPCHEPRCPNTPHECPECGQMYPGRAEAAFCCSVSEDDFFANEGDDE